MSELEHMPAGCTPEKIAAAMTKAANHRIDIRRALFTSDPESPNEIVAEFIYENGETREIETRATKLLDGRIIHQILDDWIGPEPEDPSRFSRTMRWNHEHTALMFNTPQGLIELSEAGTITLPQPPPKGQFAHDADTGQPRRGPQRE